MNQRSLALPLLLVFACAAAAQETPKPAAELQKYAPLIGSWQGSGTAQMGPGEPSKWKARSTYAWALGDFFVQEDTVVTFAGMPKPLVMRVYYGWDAENRHHVAVGVDNDGTVDVHRVDFVGDGSMVQMVETFHEGQTFLERYTSKVDGDRITFAIDMMGATGPAVRGVEGSMQRTDQAAPTAMDAGAFTATPAAPIAQLGKTAGTYAVAATMVMMPGATAMKITGKDVVTCLFDGTIVHVHTTGTAEGMPEQYVGELFYGYDAKRDCLRAVYISNMGEAGDMTGRFTPDQKQFLLTSAQTYMGQPSVQRMLMELGADGAPTRAVGHTIVGTAPPYESWNATYTKK